MQAVILAGGKGTRLKPYTMNFPKPLMPIGEYPILEIIIRQLASLNFDRITISTGHLAELIETYFGNGERWNVNIEYVREVIPLNTAGALKLLPNCEENFLVMNGDVLTTIDYRQLVQIHLDKGAKATVATTQRDAKIDFGVLGINESGYMESYTEKPSYHFEVSMGVYVLSKACIDFIDSGESVGMPDLFLRLQAAGEKVYCYRSGDYWLDIGRVDDYEKAQQEFELYKDKFIHE